MGLKTFRETFLLMKIYLQAKLERVIKSLKILRGKNPFHKKRFWWFEW